MLFALSLSLSLSLSRSLSLDTAPSLRRSLVQDQRRAVTGITIDPLPPNTLRSDFQTICNTMAFTDAVAVCETGEVPFHRAILAAYSDRIAVRLTGPKDPKKPFQVRFDGLRASTFKSFLELVYTGTTQMSVSDACNMLLAIAVPFELAHVRSACEFFIADFGADDALQVLGLCYNRVNANRPAFDALKIRCLEFVCDNFASLPVTTIRSLEAAVVYDVLEALHAKQNGQPISISLASSTSSSLSSSGSGSYRGSARSNSEIKRVNSSALPKLNTSQVSPPTSAPSSPSSAALPPPPAALAAAAAAAPPPPPIEDKKRKSRRWKSSADLKRNLQ
jgi:hypothetical protein